MPLSTPFLHRGMNYLPMDWVDSNVGDTRRDVHDEGRVWASVKELRTDEVNGSNLGASRRKDEPNMACAN